VLPKGWSAGCLNPRSVLGPVLFGNTPLTPPPSHDAAPAGTFWGIATGISVMLLCFGPGVFFLFVERFERLKPKTQSDDENSAPSEAKSL
jgi:hypothetical protein